MATITLWLLVVTSAGHSNAGTVVVIDRFPTAADCQHVLRNIPHDSVVFPKCIEAKVVRP